MRTISLGSISKHNNNNLEADRGSTITNGRPLLARKKRKLVAVLLNLDVSIIL